MNSDRFEPLSLAFVILNASPRGHTRTAVTIAKALRARGHAVTFVIGTAADSVLIDREGFTVYRTHTTRMDRAPKLPLLLTELHGRSPIDVVHSFYNSGLEDAALWGARHGVPTLLTICGGRAQSTHILPLPHLVVLQEELAEDLRRENYENTTSHVIQARVDVPHVFDTVTRLTDEQVTAFRDKHQTGDRKIILRVARAHPDYERSLIEGALAVEKLASEGYGVQFVHVGNIQDPDSFARIKNVFERINASAGTQLAVSDREVASDAAQYLKAAWAALASGRFAFESAIARLPVIVAGRKGTVGLLSPDTAPQLRHDNFTGRHLPFPKTQGDSVAELVDVLRQLLDSTDAYCEAADFGHRFVSETYTVGLAVERYEALYDELIRSAALLDQFAIRKHLRRSFRQRLQQNLPSGIRTLLGRARVALS